MSVSTPSLKTIAGWICIAIIPCFYYFYLVRFALNVPNADDFVVIMNYLLLSDRATSWQEKWHELAFEFLEHRLVFTRLVAQFIRLLFGQLDLRWVMLIGNLSLLGVAGLLYRLLRNNGFSVWYLLPIVLCLFQPIAYESHFWAISSTNYMPVCLFAMLSFYGIDKGDRSGLTAAWLLALLATYTFANGLVVWPIGLLMVALKRRWSLVLLWAVSMLVVLWAYYFNHNYHLQPSMADNLRDRFSMVIANFFLLLGAAFNTQDTWHMFNALDLPALIVGVGIACILVLTGLLLSLKDWISIKTGAFRRLTQVRQSDFLWASLLFILLSCAAFGAGRSGDGSVATDSRYRDFPVFAMALAYCCLLFVLTPAWQRIWVKVAIAASLFFCVSSYAVYTPRLLDQNGRHIAGAYNWHHNGDWLIYHETAYFSGVANSVSRDLEKQGASWYHIPDFFVDPPVLSAAKVAGPIKIDKSNQVALWFLPIDPVGTNQPYFWLETDAKTYLLPLKRPTSLSNWLHTGRSLGHSFITDLYYGRLLPPGQYSVSLYLSPANQRLLFSPNLVIPVNAAAK